MALEKKAVFVGDTAGLTTLIRLYVTGEYNDLFLPTAFETYAADIEVDGRLVHFNIKYTASQEDYNKIRPLCYADTNVIVVGFSVDDYVSFENVFVKWAPEVRHFCPNLHECDHTHGKGH